MGLRTASVRHLHVSTVMAPALTDATESQNFSLPPKSHLEPASPINSYKTKNKYDEPTNEDCLSPLNCDDLTISHTELLKTGVNNMSDSPTSMGDNNKDKMGIQKTDIINLDHIHNNSSDKNDVVDEITNSICGSGDQNDVADLIMQQIFNSMDDAERLNNTTSDLSESLSFAKELLDVDMMNISMEDHEDEQETQHRIKESQAKDLLADLQKKHYRIGRRLEFLRRRAYKLQIRDIGQHISGEIAGVFEEVHRTLKKPQDLTSKSFLTTLEDPNIPKAMPYSITKNLLRKLENSTILQGNTVARQKSTSKYFGAGSVEVPPVRTSVTGIVILPPWAKEHKNELQKVSGQLQTQLGLVQSEVDSEATESSSGGESCDEFQTYNNPHQQYLAIQKRALWKYSTERAAIAARWTWLQSQISDLEYRIRQHSDIHKQVRAAKLPVTLGNPTEPEATVATSPPSAVNGYRGELPGNAKDDESLLQCARTRPLSGFRKRKLLQVAGLHAVSKKAARPSTLRCSCVPPIPPCALCTGRTDPTHPRDPPDTLSMRESMALLDPSFHPVFSLPDDTSQSVHFEAIMKTFDWQQRSTRMKTMRVLSNKSDRLETQGGVEHRMKKSEHRKKYARLKPSTVTALSEKIKGKVRGRKPGSLNRLKKPHRHTAKMALEQISAIAADAIDAEVEEAVGPSTSSTLGGTTANVMMGDSPRLSPLLQMQSISGFSNRTRGNRMDSYDIDNIVIPYSVAAATRVEKLQYKEILTPKWRIADLDSNSSKINGTVRETTTTEDCDVEDMSEEALIARHDRCEHDERKKFLSYLKFPLGYGRGRSHKRTDSLAESSGANTPDHPLSPPPSLSGVSSVAVDAMSTTQDHIPITSPPATPQPGIIEEQLPSVALMRRRTMSQSRFKEFKIEDGTAVEIVEVPPYDPQEFPLTDDTYENMLKMMPENHHELKTNSRAQDHAAPQSPSGSTSHYYDDDCSKTTLGLNNSQSPLDSETTESAIGEEEVEEDDEEDLEDPNDPEWMEEKESRDRHRR